MLCVGPGEGSAAMALLAHAQETRDVKVIISYHIISCYIVFSRMRSEGFPFIVWGVWGLDRVRFVCCRASRSERVGARRRAVRR